MGMWVYKMSFHGISLCYTKVLEELCHSKLPFSSFLNHICGELKRCLYQSAKCKDNFSKQKVHSQLFSAQFFLYCSWQ